MYISADYTCVARAQGYCIRVTAASEDDYISEEECVLSAMVWSEQAGSGTHPCAHTSGAVHLTGTSPPDER